MRILVVDDQATLLNMVKTELEGLGYIVEATTDAKKAALLVRAIDYDLIILDIKLRQELDGISICKKARGRNKECSILMLSVLSNLETKKKCFECGADDYLIKPFDLTELAFRIKALLRRRSKPIENRVLKVLDLSLNLESREVKRAGKLIELTTVDFNLLEFLMHNQNHVISRLQITEHIWGYDTNPKANVLESHIYALRQEIDKGFDKKLLHTIYGFGYLLGEKAKIY